MYKFPPKPAFLLLNDSIKRSLSRLANDAMHDAAWGMEYEIKRLKLKYAELDLKRALAGLPPRGE